MSGTRRAWISCALIHHNFGQGLEVRLQGHTAPVWTAPRINRAFTIPAAYPDGFRAMSGSTSQT